METCSFSFFLFCLCFKLGYVDAQLKESYLNPAVSCKTQCGGDRRCIGLEICQIQEHLYQCRACCGWKKLGQEMANKNLTDCGYFQMVDDNHKRYVNVAVGKPTSMSSTINNYQLPRNAVDGVVLCRLIDLSHSRSEQNPWLKIDLQGLFDILSVLIYARQDCCEPGRLKNAMVTVFNDAENRICGFYPGPTFKHDRISVLCEPLTEGRLITLALNLEPGTYSYLQVCEVQVYGRLLQL